MAEQPQSKARKSDRQVLADRAPWKPALYTKADVAAIQALLRGEANEQQQQRALKWVIEQAAGTYDMAYRPGEDGRRDTDFALGRGFVGQQVVKLTRLNLSRLKDD